MPDKSVRLVPVDEIATKMRSTNAALAIGAVACHPLRPHVVPQSCDLADHRRDHGNDDNES